MQVQARVYQTMPVFDKSQYFANLTPFPEFGDRAQWRVLGKRIGHNQSGQRLCDHMAEKFRFLNLEQWRFRIEIGHVFVFEQPLGTDENWYRSGDAKGVVVTDVSYQLRVSDRIAMYFPIEWEPPGEFELSKLYDKDGVGVFFKPSGLPMHENGPYYRKTFANVILADFDSAWAALHRLDKETSGVVICGKDKESRKKISRMFAENRIEKIYKCLVEKEPSQKSWVCEEPIGKHPDSIIRIKKWVNPDGDTALTEFEYLREVQVPGLGRTLFEVEARPKTGRTNQIRVHLASAGLRIIGDKLYHPDENVFLTYLDEGDSPKVLQMAGFPRLALHAETIGWPCPQTGRQVRVTQPVDWFFNSH